MADNGSSGKREVGQPAGDCNPWALSRLCLLSFGAFFIEICVVVVGDGCPLYLFFCHSRRSSAGMWLIAGVAVIRPR